MEMAAPPLWLTLLRGVHDAALLSLLGALAFRLVVLPRDLAGRMTLPLSRIILAGGGLALVSGFTWFLAEAAIVADAHGIVATLNAVPAFVSYLGFARVLIARLVLIVAALTMSAWRFTALMLAAIAVAVQPWLGHAAQVGWAL